MQKITLLAGLCALAILSACGTNDVQRALTGAAAGAVVADATKNDVLVGALIGAGAGALSDDVLNRY